MKLKYFDIDATTVVRSNCLFVGPRASGKTFAMMYFHRNGGLFNREKCIISDELSFEWLDQIGKSQRCRCNYDILSEWDPQKGVQLYSDQLEGRQTGKEFADAFVIAEFADLQKSFMACKVVKDMKTLSKSLKIHFMMSCYTPVPELLRNTRYVFVFYTCIISMLKLIYKSLFSSFVTSDQFVQLMEYLNRYPRHTCYVLDTQATSDDDRLFVFKAGVDAKSWSWAENANAFSIAAFKAALDSDEEEEEEGKSTPEVNVNKLCLED